MTIEKFEIRDIRHCPVCLSFIAFSHGLQCPTCQSSLNNMDSLAVFFFNTLSDIKVNLEGITKELRKLRKRRM